MREYKFRAWDKEDKKIFSVSDIYFPRATSSVTRVNLVGGGVRRIDEVELMQYTGLIDKNGKEIYEGDIVKQTYQWSKYKYYSNGGESYEAEETESSFGYHQGEIVIIPSKGACIRNYLWEDLENDISKKIKGYKVVCASRCEVIGNIHNNPELPKGGAEE